MRRSGSDVQGVPATEKLLVSGGDARIVPDPVSGLNKYGCRSVPDPDLLAFGSSTASTISEAGFVAADRLRARLLKTSATGPIEAICAREMQRSELLSEISDLPVNLLFAASGTDAHVLASRCAAFGHPLRVVMVEEDETGSGVKAGLSALSCEISLVPLRTSDGAPRPTSLIDADVASRVRDALNHGQRVLLIMVDQSKTGLIAPSAACVADLHRRYPVEVLVDACQFRVTPATLRAYLQQGFMVALTGSKFWTGPSFSAALLLPEKFEPAASSEVNLGLLLRWEAALVEWRRFCALPQEAVVHCLALFARAVRHRLMHDPCFEPLDVPPLDRSPLVEDSGWDRIQTIFPFLLYCDDLSGNKCPLDRDQTMRVYRQLQSGDSGGVRCQLGQPVACGVRGGVPVSALRLCVSARQISDAAEKGGVTELIHDAMAALDETARLVAQFNRQPFVTG